METTNTEENFGNTKIVGNSGDSQSHLLETLDQEPGLMNFVLLDIDTLVPGVLADFSIWIKRGDGQYVLFAKAGKNIDISRLAELQEQGLQIMIPEQESYKYKIYVQQNLHKIIENEQIPMSQRVEYFTQVSIELLHKSFEQGISEGKITSDTIQQISKMVKEVLSFLTEKKSLKVLAELLGHDYDTYLHSIEVFWFTIAMVKDCQDYFPDMDQDFQKRCGVSGLLHDVAKLEINKEILNKPGALDETEWQIIKSHPDRAFEFLEDTQVPEFVLDGIKHHHEDRCGGGYPSGLAGEQIPVLARILRIVDVFAALTAVRPYKDAMSGFDALKLMTTEKIGDRDKGMKQCFDPKLLQKFIKLLSKMNTIK